ncbi:MAG: aminopeptidase P family protein [Fretibacterium sp.]|nr:aminopeptidase P family protein [Fretibacterium sp.]
MAFEVELRRLKEFRAAMKNKGMDAFVLFVLEGFNSEGCRYLSGFSGSSAALLIDECRAVLVTDGRYRTQAPAQSPFEVVIQSELPLPLYLAKAVRETEHWHKVGFEAEKVSHALYETVLRPSGAEWVDASALIASLRRSKDETEAEAIRKAAVIARQAYDKTLERVRPGMTEAEFESLLLYEIKNLGGERGWPHNDFIIASGLRGAMCHGRATQKPFELGEVVTVDYGATLGGYMSDITRNFALGQPDPRALEIDEILVRAHQAAAEALRPGLSGKEADAIARKVIADAGYGENFIHGLGHGLGLEIHEAPRLSLISKDVLQVGDVVTVEPGIYIEGWGGLRIEDDYLITEDGARCLSLSDDQHLRILKV